MSQPLFQARWGFSQQYTESMDQVFRRACQDWQRTHRIVQQRLLTGHIHVIHQAGFIERLHGSQAFTLNLNVLQQDVGTLLYPAQLQIIRRYLGQ